MSVNSKYYDIPAFVRHNSTLGKKCFSLFHVNTRSLSKNFDQLLNVLSAVETKFDVLGITETKQQVEKDFITNVDINGYCVYTQPSKSNAGGVALYVNNRLDHLERNDLGKLDDDFESI